MFSAATKTGSQPSAAPNWIDDVFSTFLYTGTSSAQTITNGIDLAGKGGLVWAKPRDSGATPPANANDHMWFDTVRTLGQAISSNTTDAQYPASSLNGFTSSGFTLSGTSNPNRLDRPYCSWTFREQPKFFDVVTYTGTGSARTISHNLGSAPGMMIIKAFANMGSLGGTSEWQVYHRSIGNTYRLILNATTEAINIGAACWNSTDPTSTVFSLGTNSGVNASGVTYVAYLFAHNAGGFGTSGTDNVISCGSFTTNGSGSATVSLGYEPQWVMIKRTDSTSGWIMFDVMRGMSLTNSFTFQANTSGAEVDNGASVLQPTATGFFVPNSQLPSSSTWIYMAIRRPMKVPTDATTVFKPLARTGTGTNPTVVTTGTNPDLLMSFPRTASPAAYGMTYFDKLRGVSQILQSANTNAEATTAGTFCLQGWQNTGFQTGADFIEGYLNYSGSTYAQYALTRASGFFDEVCYTGTGSATTFNHNLGVVPELMIVKSRSNAGLPWNVYNATIGATKRLRVNTTDASQNSSDWDSTAPTSSVFSVGSFSGTNGSGQTHVAYLFATCAGVSKVGSYTGNGTTQAIACGFTGGARFVLIKRTDSTGDWYVYDTARGMTTLTDPYLLLNSTAAESATLGSVTTTAGGFTVNATILAAINTNAASYIFLAIS